MFIVAYPEKNVMLTSSCCRLRLGKYDAALCRN